MKNVAPLFLLLLFFYGSHAQIIYEEFPVYDNGLIYSPATMDALHEAVAEKNLSFQSCEPNPHLLSYPQSTGHYFKIKRGSQKLLEAIRGMGSLDEMIQYYPFVEVEYNLPVVLLPRYGSRRKLVLYAPPLQKDQYNGISIALDSLTEASLQPDQHVIVMESDGGLEGFWLDRPLAQQKFMPEHALLIQYVDCMIDTNHLVALTPSQTSAPDETLQALLDEVDQWLNSFPVKAPDYPSIEYKVEEDDNEVYYAALEQFEKEKAHWNTKRLAYLDEKVAGQAEFQALLQQLADYAVAGRLDGWTAEAYEFYIARYHDPSIALLSKRQRRVIGGCSQDTRPREHALEIARLAAETQEWSIFLRAHLNILNDRFDRVSDGSYAWGARQTYLRELEALGLDVPELLIGSCLQALHTAEHHYAGSISRIGRALAESENRPAVEHLLLELLASPNLDLYNRIRISYLAFHYESWLIESADQREFSAAYREVIRQHFPEEISEKMDFLREDD